MFWQSSYIVIHLNEDLSHVVNLLFMSAVLTPEE